MTALALVLLATATGRAADAPKIGDTVGKLKFTDIRSLPRTLDDFGKKKAVVLVFVNTSCPVALRYLPTLQALEKEYRDKDVQFAAVNAADEDTVIAMATQSVKYEIEFPFVKDFRGECARALGVTRTPEAVVLDADRRICYRGRIDDQFRLGGVRKEPTTRELKDALDAVLVGKKVATPETEVDGCPITFPKARKLKDVTFAEHVAPILQKRGSDLGPADAAVVREPRVRPVHQPPRPFGRRAHDGGGLGEGRRRGRRPREGTRPARGGQREVAHREARSRAGVGRIRPARDRRHPVQVRDPAAPLRRGHLGSERADHDRQHAVAAPL
jgi:thiol-disulfide isomerase/thioredoxin